MSFDNIVVKNVIDNLNINQAKINKLNLLSDNELLIELYNKSSIDKNNSYLLLSSHHNYSRISISYTKPNHSSIQNNFITILKKHLLNGIIQDVEQINNDRIVRFTITNKNELKDIIYYYLYVEIMGKHSNIILCSNENQVIIALKYSFIGDNNLRIIQPGFKFEPLKQTKLNPFTFDFKTSLELLNNNIDDYAFSLLAKKEIIYRLNNNKSSINSNLFDDLSNKLYIYQKNGKQYFYVTPLYHLEEEPIIFDLFEGMDYIFVNKENKDRINARNKNIENVLKQHLKKNENKLLKLNNELEDVENNQKYRIIGDLLIINQYKITKGMKHITLTDYNSFQRTDGSFETIHNDIFIELDPRLNGIDNSKKYFNKYQKTKTGQIKIKEQINITKLEIDYLKEMLGQLSFANDNDIKEIVNELEKNRYLKTNNKNNKKHNHKKNKNSHKINYLSYIIDNDVIIHVGKNNLQNDYLTFKLARKNDYWLHVKDSPGSHVIISNVDDLDEYTLRTAAMIASYYSTQRYSSSIAVNYTLVKNIKKIPGGKPGMVIYHEYQTIYIDPDEKLIESLNVINN